MDIELILNLTTYILVAAIIVIAVCAFYYIKSNNQNKSLVEKRRWIEQIPSLVSTLGVLGTFIGITVGLCNFDTADLDNSIPLLLSGLKTAFFTSIAGMISSMFLSRYVCSRYDELDKGVSDINQAAGLITKSVSDMSAANIQTLTTMMAQQEDQLRLFEQLHNDNLDIVRILTSNDNTMRQISESLDKGQENMARISSNTALMPDIKSGVDSIITSLNTVQEKLVSISSDTANIESINDNVASSLEALGNLDASEQHVSEEIDKLGGVLQTEVGELNAVVKTQFTELSAFINKVNTQIANDVLAKLVVLENDAKQIHGALTTISSDTANIESINDNVATSLEALGNLDASEQHVSEEIDKLGGVLQTEVGELNAVVKTQFTELSAFINKVNTQIANDVLAKLVVLENDAKQIHDVLTTISSDTANIESINDNVATSLEALGNLDASEQHVSEEIEDLGAKMTNDISAIVVKMTETDKLLTTKFDEFTTLMKKNDVEELSEYMRKFAADFQSQMNNLINKLVADNFKELNKSVNTLSTWQQENKAMIASLTQQYKDMADEFENTSLVLSEVGDNTGKLVADEGKLSDLIQALNEVMSQDKTFLQVMDKMKDAADINKKNSQILNQSASSLNTWIVSQKDFVAGVEKLVKKLDEISKFRNYNSDFWKDTKEKLQEGISILNQGTKQLNDNVVVIDKHFYSRLNTTLANLDACIQAMYNDKIR